MQPFKIVYSRPKLFIAVYRLLNIGNFSWLMSSEYRLKQTTRSKVI